LDEVDAADKMVEIDKCEELINTLAPQQKLSLLACHIAFDSHKGKVTTGEAYDFYRNTCSDAGNRALTQRRFSDIVSFLDVYGLINARVISKGRYGKTRELSNTLPQSVIEKLLKTKS